MIRIGIAVAIGALAWASAASAQLDPKAVMLTPPENIQWKGEAGKVQSAVLAGDPKKDGSLYVMLLKWPPHTTSRPHSHPKDRYITLLSGSWYVNSGAKYRPDTMVPVKVGSFVVDVANEIHYDGTKDDGAVIEIVGIGPDTMISREEN